MKKLLVLLVALLAALLLLGVAAGYGTKSSGGTVSGTNSGAGFSEDSPVSFADASQVGSAIRPADTSANRTPVELETLLDAILGAAPGSAGSSMRQARAAGELLDWAQAGNSADAIALERWLDTNAVSREAKLAAAYGAVLDFADRVLLGDETTEGTLSDAGYALSYDTYDETLYHGAAQSLLGLFTRVLDVSDTSSYTKGRDVLEGYYAGKIRGSLVRWGDGRDSDFLRWEVPCGDPLSGRVRRHSLFIPHSRPEQDRLLSGARNRHSQLWDV